MFKRAERKKSRLRLALTGPSGSGKTYSALLLAQGLGGRIAVIDTERGSASLYAHLCEFDVMELEAPYSPERFIEAIRGAERGGYSVLIIDSISHEWSGIGGCLEIVDSVASAKFRGNTWSAWNDVTPRHRAFLDAMLQAPLHIIATMRSKTETSQVEENGRKKVVKLGMKAEQRDGAEYEFTTVLDISHDRHFALASKDRTGLFSDHDPQALTIETGRQLLAWLETGQAADEQRAREGRSIAATFAADAVGQAATIATLDALKAWFTDVNAAMKGLPLTAEQRAEIIAAKDRRKAELTAADDLPADWSAAPASQPAAQAEFIPAEWSEPTAGKPAAPITDAQRKAIQAHYADFSRVERLERISALVGRIVASVNDLTKDEASAVIDANAGREEA